MGRPSEQCDIYSSDKLPYLYQNILLETLYMYSRVLVINNTTVHLRDGSTIKSQWDACLDLVSYSYAVIYSEICGAVTRQSKLE